MANQQSEIKGYKSDLDDFFGPRDSEPQAKNPAGRRSHRGLICDSAPLRFGGYRL